jgi:Lrp/AsnC family transcriptional regulator for asnA, asnC and gidA
MSLDQLDLRIIRSLNQDGRKPYKTIGEELDVSDATIRKRIKRMQEDGVIKQFMVLLDYSLMGRVVKAFIGLKINPSQIPIVVERLECLADVHVLYRTTGTLDLFLEVIFSDLDELNAFLESELNIEGIIETEVNVVIGPYKRCPYTGL